MAAIRREVLFVCIGRRSIGAKKGLATAFIGLNEDGTMPDAPKMHLFKLPKGQARCGCVYSVEMEGNKLFSNTLKFLRSWGNQEELLEWDAEDRATERARQVEVLEAKIERSSMLPLMPIHHLWKSLDANARISLEVIIIKFIRNGGL